MIISSFMMLVIFRLSFWDADCLIAMDHIKEIMNGSFVDDVVFVTFMLLWSRECISIQNSSSLIWEGFILLIFSLFIVIVSFDSNTHMNNYQ